jgi:hypothetical protein
VFDLSSMPKKNQRRAARAAAVKAPRVQAVDVVSDKDVDKTNAHAARIFFHIHVILLLLACLMMYFKIYRSQESKPSSTCLIRHF